MCYWNNCSRTMGSYIFPVFLYVLLQINETSGVISLSLHYIGLTSVPNQLIDPNINNLYLDNNQISTINSSVDFAGFSQLTILVLDNNLLEEIPSMPNIASSLVELQLSVNRIKSVNPASVQLLSKLGKLSLARNFLTTFPDFYHPVLYYLYLDYNPMTVLPNLPILGKQLISMSISYSTLQSIDIIALAQYSALRYLGVIQTKLTTLPNYCAAGVNATFFNIGGYQTPWHCDCRLRWIFTTKKVIKNVFYPNMYCSSPPLLAEKKLTSLSWSQLVCDGMFIFNISYILFSGELNLHHF